MPAVKEFTKKYVLRTFTRTGTGLMLVENVFGADMLTLGCKQNDIEILADRTSSLSWVVMVLLLLVMVAMLRFGKK